MYVVIVKDAKGCSKQESVTVSPKPTLILAFTKQNTVCGATTGQAKVSATGGLGNYIWEWSTGDTTQQITGLAAGIYAVTDTDDQGCSKTNSVNIINNNGSTNIDMSEMAQGGLSCANCIGY